MPAVVPIRAERDERRCWTFGEGLPGAWSWRIAEESDCKHTGDLNLIKGATSGGQTATTNQAGIAGKAGHEMGVSVITSLGRIESEGPGGGAGQVGQ